MSPRVLCRSLLASLTALAVAACASGPARWDYHESPATGRVGLSTVRAEPKVSLEAVARGKDAGAAQGVASGAFSCGELLRGGTEIGFLLAIACIPIGAVIGGIAGAVQTSPEAALESAERQLSVILVKLQAHRRLDDAVRRYAADSGLAPLPDLGEHSSTSLDGEGRYPSESTDFVIEIALTDFRARTSGKWNLPYSFELTARGRLIRTADGQVVDTFTRRAATSTRLAEEWTAQDGKLVAEELNEALNELAESFVDEWLLVYRPQPATPPSDERQLVPDYMLRPIQPPARRDFRWFTKSQFVGDYVPVMLTGSPPTFTWESLPRAMSGEAIKDVVYDLRIREPASTPSEIAIAGRERLAVRNLREPQFVLHEPLTPCAVYFWTVRARFVRDGHMRATEWTEAYGLGGADPSSSRRGTSSAPFPRMLQLPFTMPGTACGD